MFTAGLNFVLVGDLESVPDMPAGSEIPNKIPRASSNMVTKKMFH